MTSNYGRPQMYNNIGQQGRMTGIRPPSNVPRDSGGNERASAFFDRGDFDGDGDDNDASFSARASGTRSYRASSSQGLNSSQVNGRARERPDKYNEVGERGRKTGISAPRISVDADGYQNPDLFFLSPQARPSTGGPHAATSSPQRGNNQSSRKASSSKKARPVQLDAYEQDDDDDDPQRYNREYGGGGDEDYGADSASMEIDDGSSLTPTAYQRDHRRSHGNSGLRNSITYGSPRSRGANGRPVEYSDDEGNSDEEEELVRQTVAPNSAARGSPRHGLVQMGKNGQPFRQDKGKGKAVQRSLSPEDDQPQQQLQYHEDDDDDGGEAYDNFDTYGDGGGGEFDQEDDDDQDQEQEDEEDEGGERVTPSQAKGKGRAPRRSSTSTASPASAQKRQMAAKKASQSGKKVNDTQTVIRVKPQKRPRDDDLDADGKRRSARQRHPPVEYWRNERVVYQRRASGMGMKEIVLIPKEEPEPFALRRKGGHKSSAAAKRSQSQRLRSEVPEEEGVDSMTDPEGIVWSWEGQAEISRRIAFTKTMMNARPSTSDSKFAYQKIFTELDYLAGGIIEIDPGSEKPMKPSRDNTYIFYCIEGSVAVTVHRTRFAIGPGATFLVPRGNSYQIVATSNRRVRLFFTQSRRVTEFKDGATRADKEQDYITVLQQTQLELHEQEEAERRAEEEEEDEEEVEYEEEEE